jgi:hypothetical protein
MAVFPDFDRDKHVVDFQPQKHGKSHYQAIRAAAHIKAGGTVMLATKDGLFPIVGVPGFDDGRQIEDQTTTQAPFPTFPRTLESRASSNFDKTNRRTAARKAP